MTLGLSNISLPPWWIYIFSSIWWTIRRVVGVNVIRWCAPDFTKLQLFNQQEVSTTSHTISLNGTNIYRHSWCLSLSLSLTPFFHKSALESILAIKYIECYIFSPSTLPLSWYRCILPGLPTSMQTQECISKSECATSYLFKIFQWLLWTP